MNELDHFTAALSIQDSQARAAYLEEHCQGNPPLRQRLEKLLKAYRQADEVLPEVPVIDPNLTEMFTGQKRDQLIGTLIAGKYKLLEEIGEGGMGTVFVAEQTEPVKRKVAVKLIKPGMDSKSVLARFEAERQAIAMMDHPNIAKVLDAGLTEERRPYFVMEYIKGLPLTKYCDDVKLLIDERLKLFMQICQAVQHAHQKGIIHRDLKPGNILIALYDGKPVPKVIDFGLAKALHHSLTERTLHTGHEMVLGTPLYMSPEQAELNNLDIDTRSDIYSLGVILYELLTGVTPLEKKRFKEAAWAEVLRIIKEEEPSKPSTKLSHSDSLPSVAAQRQMEPKKLSSLMKGDLDWIVMKALEKDRSRRYETANGFAADVMRYLAGEPVTAVPPSTGYRFKKFVKRNKGKVVAAGLVLAALVAGIIGTSIGMYEAKRQESLAIIAREAEAERAEGERLAKLNSEAKRQEAERNLAFARKGNDILGSVFAGLDPRANYASVAELRNALKDNLAKAVKELDGSAIGDPLEVATMQRTLGMSLLGLGEANMAIEVFAKELAARMERQGAEHRHTLAAMGNLAWAYKEDGKMDKALPLMVETLQLRTFKLGPDHPDTLTAMGNLALVYQAVGKLDLALPLMEQTLKLSITKLGADHTETLRAMGNLAHGYQAVGKLDLALPLMEQTLKLRIAKLGADHTDTITSMAYLASGYQADGKLEKALPLSEETLKLMTAKLGAEHPRTLISINNLAACYWSLNRLDRSVPLFEQLMPLQEKRLGRQHPDTLMTVANLGVNYKDAGRLKEAIPLLEESYQASRKHVSLRFAGTKLLGAYASSGETIKHANLVKELLQRARKTLPPDSPQLASELALIGSSLLELKMWHEAEPMLRECLSIREKKEPNDWRTFNTQSMLGGALLSIKKYAEAEPLLLKGYEGMRQREKSIPPQGSTRLPEALDRLIQLYTETNKPDEVKKWQAEKDKLPRAVEKKP